MSNKVIEYTEAPDDVKEFLERAVIIPNFDLTPEGIKEFERSRKKRPVNIYLTTSTVEKFKKAAAESGSRYQTMISSALDVYAQQCL